jgi:hypothetical protein
LAVVVNRADCGVGYVWVAEEEVFEFRGGDLEARLVIRWVFCSVEVALVMIVSVR